MKVAVIAAGGRSGRLVVEELLRGGHQVRAGIHRRSPFGNGADGLEVLPCNALEPEAVAALLAGCDGAVSLIGHGLKSPAGLQTTATINLVRAARKAGVNRVVSLTGSGVRFPGDVLTGPDKLVNLAMGTLLKKVVQDGIDHAEVLKNSGLDWTIIRALVLTGGKPGAFSLLPHGPAKFTTPRTEIAQAVRQVLENDTFVRQAPLMGAAGKAE